ncbi:MAG: hypothetical protein JRJ59_09135 [Deltaproteobacteria bacterium]|nr:hypothetical protein [Deltaproteobacteria bacterium]
MGLALAAWAGLAWTSAALQAVKRFEAPDPAQGRQLSDLAPILAGRPLSLVVKGQRDGLFGANIYFVTYGRVNPSRLTTSVYALGQGQTWPADRGRARLISRETMPASLIKDWSRARLLFPLQPWSKGRSYVLEFSSPEADDKTCLGLCRVKGQPGGNVFAGDMPLAGQAAVQLVYKDRYPLLVLWLHLALLAAVGLLGWGSVWLLRRPRTGPDPEPAQTWGRLGRSAVWALIGLYLALALNVAWVGDDAYITFRTVANLIHGFGLTWNTAERVQAYTHPLWMFLVSAAHFLTREFHLTSIALSLACSLGAVLLVAFKLSRSLAGALAGLSLLVLSKSFVEYSTSGLENPLSHLLLAVFLAFYFKSGQDRGRLFWLTLVAGLGLVNRLDTALIFGPPLVLAFFSTKAPVLSRLRAVTAGFLPLAAWELFSIFYYGFPFPNTAYAKLNIGLGGLELARQGLNYLLHSTIRDPLTCLVIASGLGLAWLDRNRREAVLALGLALYLACLVRIGGDWMTGRFLSLTALGAAIIIARQRLRVIQLAPVLVLALLLALVAFDPPLLSFWPGHQAPAGQARDRIWNIDDLRRFSLLSPVWVSGSNDRPAARLKYKNGRPWQPGDEVVFKGAIGHFGYQAGPSVFIVDNHCLADPLRARLPARFDPNLFMGHFKRTIPPGYLETIATGLNQIQDPDLARYYDKLTLIIRGRLWDPGRLIEIWRMNTGQYDHLIDYDHYRGPKSYYVDSNGLPLYVRSRGRPERGHD